MALGDGDSSAPPIDADAGSYTAAGSVVDLGSGSNADNAQQDVGADTVLSLIFTVQVQ